MHLLGMQPTNVHLLVCYLNCMQVQTGSRNVLAVAMNLLGMKHTRCVTYLVCDLLSVCLLVVYLNSTQLQTSSRNVLAVAMNPLCV